jgi:transaldolase
MKFFLDTGSVDEIRKASELGMVDGVTTNPSLLAKEKKPYREILKEICAIVKGPVSAEVTATDTEGMLREGREHAKIADNIVVKIPIIKTGSSFHRPERSMVESVCTRDTLVLQPTMTSGSSMYSHFFDTLNIGSSSFKN